MGKLYGSWLIKREIESVVRLFKVMEIKRWSHQITSYGQRARGQTRLSDSDPSFLFHTSILARPAASYYTISIIALCHTAQSLSPTYTRSPTLTINGSYPISAPT